MMRKRQDKVNPQQIDLLIRSIPQANIKSFYSRLSKDLGQKKIIEKPFDIKKLDSPFKLALSFSKKNNNSDAQKQLSRLNYMESVTNLQSAGYGLVISDINAYDSDSKTFYLNQKGAASLILFSNLERRLLPSAIEALSIITKDSKPDFSDFDALDIAAGLFLMHICSDGIESAFMHLSPNPEIVKKLFKTRKDSDEIMSNLRELQSRFIKKIYGHI
jgi:hypothetical protein